jgi:transitional endoplasmic reticulum ATPase
MLQNNISGLKLALAQTPNNITLHLIVANTLFENREYAEAEQNYKAILLQQAQPEAQYGLARVYFVTQKIGACILLLEEVLLEDTYNAPALLLYANALLKEGNFKKATDAYEKAFAIEPTLKDAALEIALQTKSSFTDPLHNFINSPLQQLVTRPTTNFTNVLGAANLLQQIEQSIIAPFKNPEIFNAFNKTIKGVTLLYGPKGSGKRFVAKATAGKLGLPFLAVTKNHLLQANNNAAEINIENIFALAKTTAPCVLCIENIDIVFENTDASVISPNILHQFLAKLDSLLAAAPNVLIIATTNNPWLVTDVLKNKNRIAQAIFMPPPTTNGIELLLQQALKNVPTAEIDYAGIALKMDGFTPAEIALVAERVVATKIDASVVAGKISPINTADIINTLKGFKPCLLNWQQMLKNYAVLNNDSNFYSGFFNYLKKP